MSESSQPPALVFDDVTTGAQQDFRQATHIARMMVCEWGMSELGPQSFSDREELLFLGREVARTQSHSEETSRRIDAEVTRILTEAHDEAARIVREHMDKLHLIARLLLERETLDGREVEDIVKHGRILSDDERTTADGPGAAGAPAPIAVKPAVAPAASPSMPPPIPPAPAPAAG